MVDIDRNPRILRGRARRAITNLAGLVGIVNVVRFLRTEIASLLSSRPARKEAKIGW